MRSENEVRVIGSEFLKEYNKEENIYFGQTLRTWVLILAIIMAVGVMVLVTMILELSSTIALAFSSIVGAPAVWYGIDARKLLDLDARLHFFLLKKRRIYEQSEKNDEGEADVL